MIFTSMFFKYLIYLHQQVQQLDLYDAMTKEFDLPSSSTTCSSTDEGTVSSSSSDRSLLSPSFHVNSCSANAMARGNSSGKECSTSTAPGGGDTPVIQKQDILFLSPNRLFLDSKLKQPFRILTQFDVDLISGYDHRGVLVGGGRGSKACVGR